jgi:hypothetical protein
LPEDGIFPLIVYFSTAYAASPNFNLSWNAFCHNVRQITLSEQGGLNYVGGGFEVR